MTRMRADDFPPDHPAWSILLGATPFQACLSDPRFAYTMHIPSTYRYLPKPLPLLVAIHGIRRQAERTRDRFASFAEKWGVAVLAPLFPTGIEDPDDIRNYTHLRYRGICFDDVLLAMVEEASERWRLDSEKFMLAGFSAGGQFAHRFAYTHPTRLSAVSVGAPGRVTLPQHEPWPFGIGDVDELFRTEGTLADLANVPYQIVVGDEDVATGSLDALADDPKEQRTGSTRVERARRLAEELVEIQVPVELDVIPGAGHDADEVALAVTEFLTRVVQAKGRQLVR